VTADADHPEHLSPETVDYGRIAKVATRSKPINVLLMRCDAQLNVAADELDEDWLEKTYIAYDTHLAEHDGERFNAHAGFLALHFRGLDPGTDDLPAPDADTQPDVLIEAKFDLTYSVDTTEDLDEQDLEHFAFVNSTLHAWPYWRELAHSMTTRMGLRPLIVGTFKLPSPYDPEADGGELRHDDE